MIPALTRKSASLRRAALTAGLLCVLLAGCGGGGPTAPTNTAPTANAGTDQSVIETATVQLAGSGNDSDGGTLSYAWSQISGPSGDFDSTAVANAVFNVPLIPVATEEDIVLRLTVSDGQGGTATDDVTITAASADYVVFLATKDTAVVQELYQYETQSDTLRRMNGSLVSGGGVLRYSISPDGTSIAYTADQDVDNTTELYVAAADGSGVTKINPTMANLNGDVSEFQWSPDGSQIVYVADADTDNVGEVFLADRDGSNHAKINGFVGNPATARLIQPTWSPDGRYIAQIVVSTGNGRRFGINTHDTQAGGFNSVRVTSLPSAANVGAMAWSAGGASLAFTADQDTDDILELYAVSPSGTGERKLNAALQTNASVQAFDWAPDGSRVSYLAEQESAGVVELFSALPDGTGNTKVNAALVANGDVSVHRWAPDSSRIAYRSDQVTDGVPELFAADPDGANNAAINGPIVGTGRVGLFLWSPDSTRIAYQATQETAGVFDAYVSASDGTGNVKVNGPLVTGGSTIFNATDPEANMWSPDGARFTYAANQFSAGVAEHFVSDLSGGGEVIITRTPVASGRLQSFAEWSADSSALLYTSQQDSAVTIELYLASADGMSNQAISGPIVTGGNVASRFSWSP